MPWPSQSKASTGVRSRPSAASNAGASRKDSKPGT